jgi:lysozyme
VELIERIKQHEGLRLKPYKCSAGKLTIGYGRNLQDVGITTEEAEIMLEQDIIVATRTAEQFNWYRKLNQERQSVIIEMIFNLGLPRFLGFKKMIQALREDDYAEAAEQMLDSLWSKQVGKRAKVLAEIMEG